MFSIVLLIISPAGAYSFQPSPWAATGAIATSEREYHIPNPFTISFAAGGTVVSGTAPPNVFTVNGFIVDAYSFPGGDCYGRHLADVRTSNTSENTWQIFAPSSIAGYPITGVRFYLVGNNGLCDKALSTGYLSFGNDGPVREPPVAAFTATPLSGLPPLNVQFTDTSTGSPTSWSWSFGDGGTSTQQNPSYPYTTPGSYTVQLTATNAYGSNTETKTGYVVVTAPPTPTPTVTVTPTPPSPYCYSMTKAEFKNDPTQESLEHNFDNDIMFINRSLHEKSGWDLKFYHDDSTISSSDFGTSGEGLNDATFHFHFGHGDPTQIELPHGEMVSPLDVNNKWGKNNKWVFLYSCKVLENLQWGQSLDTSHGIFGFQSTVHENGWLMPAFLQYATEKKMPLYLAYKNASIEAYDEKTTAAVIFYNKRQAYGDHLPGYGSVESDGNPNDILFVDNWTC
ncbi:MAG: PKD domain-containing protein [Methanoregula sp.]